MYWINELLGLYTLVTTQIIQIFTITFIFTFIKYYSILKMEFLGTGSIYCSIVDAIYPGSATGIITLFSNYKSKWIVYKINWKGKIIMNFKIIIKFYIMHLLIWV